MEKTVFQIAICEDGNIPEDRVRDMETVKGWSSRKGYIYELITELPAEFTGVNPRIASDWIRIQRLAESKYACWVDWDITLIKDIPLGESPLLVPFLDPLIYNGCNNQIFQQLLQVMEERKVASGNSWKVETLAAYKAWRKVNYSRAWMLKSPDDYFIHHFATINSKQVS